MDFAALAVGFVLGLALWEVYTRLFRGGSAEELRDMLLEIDARISRLRKLERPVDKADIANIHTRISKLEQKGSEGLDINALLPYLLRKNFDHELPEVNDAIRVTRGTGDRTSDSEGSGIPFGGPQ